MLPSSHLSSPPRPALINLTNGDRESPLNRSFIPPDRKRIPTTDPWTIGSRKRVKLEQKRTTASNVETDSDEDDQDLIVPVRRVRRITTVYGVRDAMAAGPSSLARLSQRQCAVDFTLGSY